MGFVLRSLATAWLAVAVGAAPACALASASADPGPALRRHVDAMEQGATVEAFGVRLAGSDVLSAFYRERDFRPAWSEASRVDELLRVLGESSAQGLDPASYHLPALRASRPHAGDSDDSAARFDLLLTASLVQLAYDVRFGRVPASSFDRHTLRERRLAEGDPVADLAAAVEEGRVAAFVEGLEPQLAYYRRLKQALAESRRVVEAGGWPPVPTGPSLKPGSRDPRVPPLRARLAASGELAGGAKAASQEGADLYDDRTVAAVKAFQQAHGLDADGVLGAQTVAAMNVTAEAREGQVRATLERARALLRDLPERFVMVNAPAYRVQLFDHGNVQWKGRAIVGKPDTPTPIFRADMRSVLLNPTWTVPASIVRNELIPEMRADPHHLAKRHISVIDGDYVQAAGPDNALGRIKLNLPNPHSVYLHDTPTRNLFATSKRAYSHGCIRIENPVQLAALALDDPAWTVQSLDAAIATGKTRTVLLKKPLPVYVMYWTVSFDSEGRVEFFADLYGRDAELLNALDAVHGGLAGLGGLS